MLRGKQSGEGFGRSRRTASECRQSAGGQTLVQNRFVNANALNEQLPISVPQVFHQSPPMPDFQNTYTTNHGQSVCLCQPSRRTFIYDGEIGFERPGKQYCGKLALPKRATRMEAKDLVGRSSGVGFDPFGGTDQMRRRSARTANHDFLSHFLRDVNFNEELPQYFKLAHASQRDEGRGVGNRNHSFNREAVS